MIQIELDFCGIRVKNFEIFRLNVSLGCGTVDGNRILILSLIFFCHRIVKLPSSDDVRLVDDAFIKICHMVNDLSMSVRREATGLLGSLHLVSPKFLEQTLDKKLMSHLKVSFCDKL